MSWVVSAALLCIFRYLRLVVNFISNWSYKPIPIPDQPTYTSEDVTIIIPTLDGEGEELRRTIETCLSTEPAEVILVTVAANLKKALKLTEDMKSRKIRVLDVAKANKRRQMCLAIPEVKTKITIFADDDVIWPTTIMPWMLAPFEDELVGAVGTSQRLVRSSQQNIWTFCGSIYLERRNFDCCGCLNIDGGLPCLSGRTAAYRTCILQDEHFQFDFTNETWRSYQLNADDDNFLTRWMFNHGWKIRMQYHKACEVQTTLENSPTYVKQCLRWVRSNWRSNLTSMFVERHCWWIHPWTTYSVFLTTITAWAVVDPVLFYMIYNATETSNAEARLAIRVCAAIWIFLLAKLVKVVGHFIRYPADLRFLPLFMSFGYFHGLLKFAGLCTLSETAWGSREGADMDNRFRMIRLPSYNFSSVSPSKSASESAETTDDLDNKMSDLPRYSIDDQETKTDRYHD